MVLRGGVAVELSSQVVDFVGLDVEAILILVGDTFVLGYLRLQVFDLVDFL